MNYTNQSEREKKNPFWFNSHTCDEEMQVTIFFFVGVTSKNDWEPVSYRKSWKVYPHLRQVVWLQISSELGTAYTTVLTRAETKIVLIIH